MFVRHFCCALITAFFVVAPGVPVFADGSSSAFIHSLVKSELVFEGEVVAVDYGLSRPADDQRSGFAHTFVTFQVDWVLRGSFLATGASGGETPPERATLTLRFMGGVEGDDQYSIVSGTPLFDVGDRDLLVVTGNGSRICPLADCKQGRYRYIDGLVYNEDGHEIVATDEASVLYGKPHFLPEVMTHRMGETALEIINIVEPNEGGLPPALPDFGQIYDIAGFRAVVESTLAELEAAGLLTSPEPVQSQDITVAFDAVNAEPVTALPPVTAQASEPDTGFLVADRLEAKLLRRNGGNPVLEPRREQFLSAFREREMRRLGRIESARPRR